MAQDLWRLRQIARLTINDLASQSGVPALSIYEYERGRAIRGADLPKLAGALGVEPGEVKVTSAPKPRQERARPGDRRKGGGGGKPKAESRPVTPTQIQHLLALATKMGRTQDEVVQEAGRPLEELNKKEASQLLNQYTQQIRERKEHILADPSGTKRWRAHLPEGVDGFELNYLTNHQENQSRLTFTLFDGTQFTGRIGGFGPYNITIRTRDKQEITIQKLALAYYAVATPEVGES